jgi:hypothetical protein
MKNNTTSGRQLTAIFLLWHLLALAAICLSPILFSGSPVWELDAKRLPLYVIVAAGYLAAASVSSWVAYRAGTWKLSTSLATWLAMLSIVFLAILVTRMTYSRSVLLQLCTIATALTVAPVVFRWIPRLTVAGLAAVTLGLAFLSTSGHGSLLRSQPMEHESRAALPTMLYNVLTTEFHGKIPGSSTKGGGLSRFGDDLLLADAIGQLYILQIEDGSASMSARQLPFGVPLNKADFIAGTDPSIDQRRFRVGDILAQDLGDRFRIFASYHHWNVADECFTVRVSSALIDATGNPLEDAEATWTTLFESVPCLGVREAKNGAQTEYPRFAGHQMGGRLVQFDDRSLLLSVGDHRYDGLNSPLTLPQDDASSYGKTILIDLVDNSQRIFSLGHRNAQGLTVDGSGNVWLTEHGPQGGDELNRVLAGTNYGWPMVTYGTDYGSSTWPLNETQGDHRGFERPVFAWGPSKLGISSLIALQRDLFPLWQNDLIISTLSPGLIIRARLYEDRLIYAEPIRIGKPIRDLVEMENGTIVLWTDAATSRKPSAARCCLHRVLHATP